jgi:hypothetical protein
MSYKRGAMVAVSYAVLGLAVAVAPASAEGRPETTCPKAFNLGALTLAQRLQLPKVQAGLEAGIYTLEDLIAGTEFLDHNGNGLLCVQDIPQWDNAAAPSGFDYFGNVVDDNAAAHT